MPLPPHKLLAPFIMTTAVSDTPTPQLFPIQHLDAVVLHHWANTLNSVLTGAKISKVNHLNHRDFCLTLWGHHLDKDNNRLLISINKQAPAFFLTDTQTVADLCDKAFDTPTGFCMLLRKHLQNGVIESVSAMAGERVVIISIRNTNEMGQQVYWQLIAELMGKQSNLLLVETDTQTITGTAHHVTETMSRTREIYPGIPYCPPPTAAHKQWLGHANLSVLESIVQQNTSVPELKSALFSHYWGAGAITIESLPIQHSSPEQVAQLLLAWTLGTQPINPILDSQNHLCLTPGDEHANEQCLKTLPRFYYQQLSQLTQQQEGRLLLQALNRAKTKLDDQAPPAPEDQQQLAKQHQRYGDLLTTALSCGELPTKTGALDHIILNDWDTDLPVTIPIDPAKGWQENAHAHYQKAKKSIRQAEYHASQADAFSKQLAYIQQLQWALQHASSPAELRDLRDELMSAGFMRDRYAQSKKHHVQRKKQQQPQVAIPGLLQAQNTEGVRFWIGKQNKANDMLVGKLSKPSDLWLHAHNMPGAHVVIVTDGQDLDSISDETLHDGLHLAAYFSPGRLSPNLPVIYTQRRYVKKIPGSYPGHVNYREEYTAYITADEDRVLQLLSNHQQD